MKWCSCLWNTGAILKAKHLGCYSSHDNDGLGLGAAWRRTEKKAMSTSNCWFSKGKMHVVPLDRREWEIEAVVEIGNGRRGPHVSVGVWFKTRDRTRRRKWPNAASLESDQQQRGLECSKTWSDASKAPWPDIALSLVLFLCSSSC
jgi:hypothetical protein